MSSATTKICGARLLLLLLPPPPLLLKEEDEEEGKEKDEGDEDEDEEFADEKEVAAAKGEDDKKDDEEDEEAEEEEEEAAVAAAVERGDIWGWLVTNTAARFASASNCADCDRRANCRRKYSKWSCTASDAFHTGDRLGNSLTCPCVFEFPSTIRRRPELSARRHRS